VLSKIQIMHPKPLIDDMIKSKLQAFVD